jgi:hypothetical protein
VGRGRLLRAPADGERAVRAARRRGARRRRGRPTRRATRSLAAHLVRPLVRAHAGPGGRPSAAFRTFLPPPARPDAPERLLAAQAELHALLDRAAGRDLRAPRVHSPVTRLLTLRAGEALEMLVVHQDRHLLQAAAVRREPAFPAPERPAPRARLLRPPARREARARAGQRVVLVDAPPEFPAAIDGVPAA